MNKQALIGDALQMFKELPFEKQIVMRYGYISTDEMAEDIEHELQDAEMVDITELIEYINFLKAGKNG